jgi:tetratricopeptide (TPR) repeat protein
MALNPGTVAPTLAPASTAQEADAGGRLARHVLLALALVATVFVGTYGLAWFRASQLAATFLADADRSYAAGKYIDALTGYEELNPATNAYVTHGGYMKVAKIWASPQAWPRPAGAAQAQARIDEILSQKLTIADAEAFIQANVGKPNPYMGTIYLRLGELYEQSGDLKGARSVYTDIANLFPDEADLIARASANLARLP